MVGESKHEHGHKHSGNAASNRRRLTLVLALTFTYMLAEAVGGFLTNSLALLSDAGHMLTDVAALVLAMLALWFSSRPVTVNKTYGYYRMEILAALANGVALVRGPPFAMDATHPGSRRRGQRSARPRARR